MKYLLGFLIIIMILTGPLSTNYSAFAAKDDKPQHTSCSDLGSFEAILDCVKNAAENASSIGSLQGARDAIRAVIALISGEHDARKAADENLQNQINNIQLLPGPPGPKGDTGTQGLPGTPGTNGTSCWDTNGNGVGDPTEDKNLDGVFNALDCQGPQGPAGTSGTGSVIFSTIHREITVTIPAGSTVASGRASCLPGESITGGGGEVLEPGWAITTSKDAPAVFLPPSLFLPNGWVVIAKGPPSGGSTLTVQVICGQISP